MSENSPTPTQPVIESASATTSPDNANSGPFAYVVTAIAVALALAVASAITGCVSALGQYALGGSGDWGYAYEDTYLVDDTFEDDYLDDLPHHDLDGLEELLGRDVTETFLS